MSPRRVAVVVAAVALVTATAGVVSHVARGTKAASVRSPASVRSQAGLGGSTSARTSPALPGRAAVARASPSGEASAQDVPEAIWGQRLDRARTTLERYRAATRYPPTSRPASEQPDQMQLAAPERSVPIDGEDGVQAVLRQDRVTLAGDEAVTLTVQCVDRRGSPSDCTVSPGTAHEPPHAASALPGVPVPFAPGAAGAFQAVFQPRQAGFAAYSGTLRVDFDVGANGASRHLFFDVLYTAVPPAELTGAAEDVLDKGSVLVKLGIKVRTPGRYVISARVDDAHGQPFAFLTFNDVLSASATSVPLTVFGLMILDQRPAFPLVVRDVEGFLLKESGDPDRELLKPLLGEVHRTREYAASELSSDEWTSEQRERYLRELASDVRTAQSHLH